ncbi:hypothetical protein BGZ63DRAFT_425872 [Mariannaea sp. PMI_226]|nr:hypothetical protein BGZ63DRAFT_425872 [Mariannaea sp. PMI_226]
MTFSITHDTISMRRVLVRSGSLRAASLSVRAYSAPLIHSRFNSTAPATIADGSFWRNLVPKPLRKENRQLRKKTKQWNPATFFIVIFLLIGSMSIQLIAVRNSFDRYMRQAEARIATLREVVEKIQKGEPVDVEKVLGTGDVQKEADWEEMLKAIERDEAARQSQKQEKAKQSEPTTTKAAAPPQAEEPTWSPEATTPRKPKPGSFGNFF